MDMTMEQYGLQELGEHELLLIDGGVKGVYDEEGNLIRSCTGPFIDIFPIRL